MKRIASVLVLTFMLFQFSGCMSLQDVYGCYGSGNPEDSMRIITPEYILHIPPLVWKDKSKYQIMQFLKGNYEIERIWNGYVIEWAYWFRLKTFLFIPYEDRTVWCLGFPLDGLYIRFFPKLSEEKALEYLKKRDLDLDKIRKLPIQNYIGKRFFLIPDDSVPEIMERAKQQ